MTCGWAVKPACAGNETDHLDDPHVLKSVGLGGHRGQGIEGTLPGAGHGVLHADVSSHQTCVQEFPCHEGQLPGCVDVGTRTHRWDVSGDRGGDLGQRHAQVREPLSDAHALGRLK